MHSHPSLQTDLKTQPPKACGTLETFGRNDFIVLGFPQKKKMLNIPKCSLVSKYKSQPNDIEEVEAK